MFLDFRCVSAVTNADRIIVLDNGRVAEEGTHAQLLKAGLPNSSTALLASQPATASATPNPTADDASSTTTSAVANPWARPGLYAQMWALQRLDHHHHQPAPSSSTAALSSVAAVDGNGAAHSNGSASERKHWRRGSLPPAKEGASAEAASPSPSSIADAAVISATHVAVAVTPGGSDSTSPSSSSSSATASAEPTKATAAAASSAAGDKKGEEKDDKAVAAAAGIKLMPGQKLDSEVVEKLATLPPVPNSRVWAFFRPEFPLFGIGLILALANGIVFPGFSMILSRFTAAFFLPDNGEVHAKALFYMGE